MIRLHVVVEGPTEKLFVDQVLSPDLGVRNIVVDSRAVRTGRHRGIEFKGGLSQYSKLKADVMGWMKQDAKPDAWFTTMIDLYGLPNDFPGFTECRAHSSVRERVACLEGRLADDLNHLRFIPYIQLHEFEALLFADPEQFRVEFPLDVQAIKSLESVRGKFFTPEEIDDSPESAPSKRILKLLPDYGKTTAGPTIAKRIGLPTLRRECPHFNQWIGKIEAVAR